MKSWSNWSPGYDAVGNAINVRKRLADISRVDADSYVSHPLVSIRIGDIVFQRDDADQIA